MTKVTRVSKWATVVVGTYVFTSLAATLPMASAVPPGNAPRICVWSRPGIKGTGTRGLYSMAKDASERERLKGFSRSQGCPVWSPNGRRVLYVMRTRDGNTAIMRARVDGSAVKRLTHKKVYNGSPSWSPSGRRVAFVRSNRKRSKAWVMTMRASGRHKQRIARGTPGDWAPDGSRILFEHNRIFYTIKPNGRARKRLTPSGEGDYYGGSWSPDGKWIAALRVSFGDEEIVIIRRNGSEIRTLNAGQMLEPGFPLWSPDGDSILLEDCSPCIPLLLDPEGGPAQELKPKDFQSYDNFEDPRWIVEPATEP